MNVYGWLLSAAKSKDIGDMLLKAKQDAATSIVDIAADALAAKKRKIDEAASSSSGGAAKKKSGAMDAALAMFQQK